MKFQFNKLPKVQLGFLLGTVLISNISMANCVDKYNGLAKENTPVFKNMSQDTGEILSSHLNGEYTFNGDDGAISSGLVVFGWLAKESVDVAMGEAMMGAPFVTTGAVLATQGVLTTTDNVSRYMNGLENKKLYKISVESLVGSGAFLQEFTVALKEDGFNVKLADVAQIVNDLNKANLCANSTEDLYEGVRLTILERAKSR